MLIKVECFKKEKLEKVFEYEGNLEDLEKAFDSELEKKLKDRVLKDWYYVSKNCMVAIYKENKKIIFRGDK